MKLQSPLLCAASLAFVACAGQEYSVHIGPTFARVDGDIALANSAGVIPPANDLNNSLGFGGPKSALVQGQMDADRHRVRLSVMNIDTSGQSVLDNDYGDILAGTAVTGQLDFTAIVGNYSYEVVREQSYRFGLGAQLGYYTLDVNVRSANGREDLATNGLMPMPYFEAEYFCGDFTFGAAGGIFAGHFGDSDGLYWDLESYGIWHFDRDFDMRAGYRYLVLDGDGRATSRDFDAAVDVQGFYVTFGYLF